MPLFRNVLVGVDLTQYDPTSFEPSAVARGVLRQALWLGGKASARLTFFSALNIGSELLPQIEETDYRALTQTVEQNARRILDSLVQQARAQGIDAADKLVIGSGWLELVRQAIRGSHDLVLIGTRDRTGFEKMLFGSTAIKVIRRCPCPVWVAKPQEEIHSLKILVASDLSALADDALRLAVELAHVAPTEIHVLHVVDFPLDRFWSTGLPDVKEREYRQRIRAHAVKEIESQLDRTGARQLTPPVGVHLIDEPGCLPDVGVHRFMQKQPIDLLIMGTIGRGGIAGVMIGNTAERILPELNCSLLAIKTKDFVSPVKV